MSFAAQEVLGAELGINPSTLYRKTKSLGLELAHEDGWARPNS
jgi:hypothetical protein